MKINIFEGARRMAFLSAGLATVVTLFFAITYEPYIPVSYTIAFPNANFIHSEESCPSDAGTHYFDTITSSGKSVSINLCLLPILFEENKEWLIPYKIDEKDIVWGAASYSSEVSAYENELEKGFKIPASDEDFINKEVSREYKENMISVAGYLVAGLAVFAGVVWAVGWIVRGFLGIPRGMDKRTES